MNMKEIHKMTLHYTMTQEDYIEYNLFHLENSKQQKHTNRLLRFGLSIFGGIFVYFGGQWFTQGARLYWTVVAIIFMTGWYLYFPQFMKKTQIKSFKKLLKEGDNSALFGKRELVVHKDYLELKDATTTSILNSKNLLEWKETENLIILYVSSITAHVIPKRDLSGSEYESIRVVLQ